MMGEVVRSPSDPPRKFGRRDDRCGLRSARLQLPFEEFGGSCPPHACGIVQVGKRDCSSFALWYELQQRALATPLTRYELRGPVAPFEGPIDVWPPPPHGISPTQRPQDCDRTATHAACEGSDGVRVLRDS